MSTRQSRQSRGRGQGRRSTRRFTWWTDIFENQNLPAVAGSQLIFQLIDPSFHVTLGWDQPYTVMRMIGELRLRFPNNIGDYRGTCGVIVEPEEMVDAAVHWDPRSDGNPAWMWMGQFLVNSQSTTDPVPNVIIPIDSKARRVLKQGDGTVLIVESGGMAAAVADVDAWVRTLVMQN